MIRVSTLTSLCRGRSAARLSYSSKLAGSYTWATEATAVGLPSADLSRGNDVPDVRRADSGVAALLGAHSWRASLSESRDARAGHECGRLAGATRSENVEGRGPIAAGALSSRGLSIGPTWSRRDD